MKLIIDIPDNIYYAIKITQPFISGKLSGKTYLQILVNSVQNGTPLDDVKAKIEQKIVKRHDLNHTRLERNRNDAFLEVLEIIDNIGKVESEE